MMLTYSKELGSLAAITAGHPIRDAVRNVPGGDTAVVQIKNVSADAGVDWPTVAKTTLTGRREPDWLKPGDILFSARGQRNVAVCLNQPPTRAVCSPHFFLIRVKDEALTLPEFLAWQMNLPKAQRYFAQSATGSYITSIRRQVLETLPVQIPSLNRQRLLVRLAHAAGREKQLIEKLTENRQRELELVARKLLT
jgi:restriction endonuclease S subunit